MDENANPNTEVSTSLDAAAPAYYPEAHLPLSAHNLLPPSVLLPAYPLPPPDVPFLVVFPLPYVLYTLNVAAPVVAPTPAKAELSTSTPVQVPLQYRVCFSYIFNFQLLDPGFIFSTFRSRFYVSRLSDLCCIAQSERLLSKELKFTRKLVYIDLQKNQKGLYFHVKDLSAKDYILLDLSGLDEFLTHLNHFVETNTKHFLENNNYAVFLFDIRTMTFQPSLGFFFFFFKFNKFF